MIICGTGHRPQDLPCGFIHKDRWKLQKIQQIKDFLISYEVSLVISGMAIGYDTWLAHTSISLNISTTAYVPFKGQENMWNDVYKQQYHKVLSRCNSIKYICDDGYAAWKMQRRNEEMIKDADCVLALWNPDKKYGGTWNAVAHALSVNKTVFNIWSESTQKVGV